MLWNESNDPTLLKEEYLHVGVYKGMKGTSNLKKMEIK